MDGQVMACKFKLSPECPPKVAQRVASIISGRHSFSFPKPISASRDYGAFWFPVRGPEIWVNKRATHPFKGWRESQEIADALASHLRGKGQETLARLVELTPRHLAINRAWEQETGIKL